VAGSVRRYWTESEGNSVNVTIVVVSTAVAVNILSTVVAMM